MKETCQGKSMLSELRSIYFMTEFKYPPFEAFMVSRDQVQDLFQKLSQDPAFRYENLDRQASPPFMSTRGDEDKGESRCEIGKDSIRFIEDRMSISVEDFADRACKVLETLGEDCPPIFYQKCEVECLAQPHVSNDSLVLLAGVVSNVANKIGPFGRPPSFFGVRFRFAPYNKDEDEDEDQKDWVSDEDHSGFITARFETYSKDRSMVWIEVVSSNPCKEIISPKNLDTAKENILSTSRFAQERCIAFLNQYDDEESDGETNEEDK